MKASMKNTLYKVLVILLNTSGDVCCAACTCPAGAGLGRFGNCNHVRGVLFALEDFNRKGYQDCPEPVSCTSKLSAWNVPTSFVAVSPVSIDETVIKRIRFCKDNDKSNQPNTEHGKLYESHVCSLYRAKVIQDGYDPLIIDEPGLTVCKSFPYLAASLDGIMKFKENSWGLDQMSLL
eukprot:gene9942-18554_t